LGGYFSRPERLQVALGELMSSLIDGHVKLHIGARLPLAKASEAHRLLEERQTLGKIILEPWTDVDE
jgi:NADPH2:quinone reductase